MKGLITIIFVFITLNLSAQDLTYKQAQDIAFTRTIKNGTKFKSYKCENGTVINIGDTLTLGEPHSNKEQTDDVWGNNKVYDFILYGNLMMQLGGMVYLPTSHKSEDIIVEKFLERVDRGEFIHLKSYFFITSLLKKNREEGCGLINSFKLFFLGFWSEKKSKKFLLTSSK